MKIMMIYMHPWARMSSTLAGEYLDIIETMVLNLQLLWDS
jgi:hypothetical protein